ncbi:MAG: polysaccharide deacetylase family protein [Bacteroidetes bacterium]|nr:polysaccharide deacetylase family protein [Bacteroidota bacterium]
MLNFKNANILLLCVVTAMTLKYFSAPFSPTYFILPFFIWSLLVFYGCYRIDSGFFIKIKCKEDTEEKVMSLTFDDGPSPEHTAIILDILKVNNVKATFFCIGRNIEGNEDLLKRMHREGHTIGNHSYSHAFWFDLFSKTKMTRDLEQFDLKMRSIIGVRPKLFRPPYGVTNPNVKASIINGNYFPVGWSIRSMDTVAKDKVRLLKNVSSGFAAGEVILFHDTCEITKEILPELLALAREQGFHWKTIDQLFHTQAYV